MNPHDMAPPETTSRWLADTPLLQLEHPRIRLLALKLTQLRTGPWQKALACHAYVAGLEQGRVGDAARVSALEVLRMGRGDTRTQCTLLIALLRSLGIPARLLAVVHGDASPHAPFWAPQPPGPAVFTEAWINGQWRIVAAASGLVCPPGSSPARLDVFDDVQHYCQVVPREAQPGWALRGMQAMAAALTRAHAA